MNKIILTVLALALFSGCGDTDADFTATDTPEITEAQKLEKNPQFGIYSSECTQETNKTLCGYSGDNGEGDSGVPTMPSEDCSDTVYCL